MDPSAVASGTKNDMDTLTSGMDWAQPDKEPRKGSLNSAQTPSSQVRMPWKAEGGLPRDGRISGPNTPRRDSSCTMSTHDGEDSMSSSTATLLTNATTVDTPGPASPTGTHISVPDFWQDRHNTLDDVSPLRHAYSLPAPAGNHSQQPESRPRTPPVDAEIAQGEFDTLPNEPPIPKRVRRLKGESPHRSMSLPLRDHRGPSASSGRSSMPPSRRGSGQSISDEPASPLPSEPRMSSSLVAEIQPENAVKHYEVEMEEPVTPEAYGTAEAEIRSPDPELRSPEQGPLSAPDISTTQSPGRSETYDPDPDERLTEDICNLILRRVYGLELHEIESPLEAWAAVNGCLEQLTILADAAPTIAASHVPTTSAPESPGGTSVRDQSGTQRSPGGKSSNGSRRSLKRTTSQKDGWSADDSRDNGESDGEERGSGRGEGGANKKIKITEPPLSLSCPYRKKNPARFNVREHEPCALQAFTNFFLLKRHVRTFHRRSTDSHVCPRCKVGMVTKEALDLHLNVEANRICESRPAPVAISNDPEEGITAKVEDILIDRRSHHKIDNWESLWRLLFPGTPIPFPDFVPPVEIDEVREHFEQNFVALTNMILDEMPIALPCVEKIERDAIARRFGTMCRDFITDSLNTCRQSKCGVARISQARRHRTRSSEERRGLLSASLNPLQSRAMPVTRTLAPRDVTNASSLSSSIESFETANSSTNISASEWSNGLAPNSATTFGTGNNSNTELPLQDQIIAQTDLPDYTSLECETHSHTDAGVFLPTSTSQEPLEGILPEFPDPNPLQQWW